LITEHPYTWFSLLPPVVAILLAIITRRVVPSLLLGIFFGALVLSHWNPIQAVTQTLSEHLLNKLLDPSTLQIFLFTLTMGMMVGVIDRAGGMQGLVNALTPLASNRRRGQLATWLMGLAIFFDDYANTVLLGNTMRPLTDRLRISREKLAYLVDSTAAPVAGLFLVSTWIASEIGFVQEGLNKIPAASDWNAFELFVASIPYRFYVLWTLLFVPIVALLGRDFGPMLQAERAAQLREDQADLPKQSSELTQDSAAVPHPPSAARWYNAVIPVAVVVVSALWFLYTSGEPAPDKNLMATFGDADAYASLVWAAFAGLLTAMVLIAPQRIITKSEMASAAGQGAKVMMPALVILWLAQTLSTMTGGAAVGASQLQTAAWMQVAGADNAQIAAELSSESVPAVMQSMVQKDLVAYQIQVQRARQRQEWNAAVAERLWQKFQTQIQETGLFLSDTKRTSNLMSAGYSESEITAALEFGSHTPFVFSKINFNDETAVPETNSSVAVSYYLPAYVQRTTRLYTGDFLAGKVHQMREQKGWITDHFTSMMPTVVFLLAAVIAFSTGTSWGTMGIVLPMVIPLVYSQLNLDLGSVQASHPIFLGSIGGVLAGAIFGDHCSPISDTTVLSSQASGCDHAAHVRTQLPYALLVAFISVVCGTIPIGYGVSVWWLLPVGVILLLAILRIFGKASYPEA
jgi:Na+/H+ antiporter NhaC